MMKNLCVFIVFLCVALGAGGGVAKISSGDLLEVQNQQHSLIDGGLTEPYLDETVTIDSFWNMVAMFKFNAEKGTGAVLKITRVMPETTISRGFVSINNNIFRLDDLLAGPDTVFTREVKLGKNNHVFVHLFGDPGAGLHVQVLPPLPPLPFITDFTVNPDRVTAGQSAMLTWAALQADTVIIEPDIGQVPLDGSLEVTPGATTMYTLTASNSYGSNSVSVSLEVLYPPELVIIEPDGLDDMADGSYTIIWTDNDPDSNAEISLYYDADNPHVDDTLIVSGLMEDPDSAGDQYLWDTSLLEPGDYYVYAVIDDGSNAPITDYSSGPVTVMAAAEPVVTISADPSAILSGDSTTLSWTSTDAETCVIEPDIGSVDTNGSLVVTPDATTTYIITAIGPGGMATAEVTVQCDCQLGITIMSPAVGAYISRPDTLVMGIIDNVANRTTAVSVNGIVAVVHGNQFVVNHLPLEDGNNTITITVEDTTGCTQTVSRQVVADTTGHYIDATPTLYSGLPVFTSNLYLNASFPILSSIVNVNGPGTIDLTQQEVDEYSLEVTDEGVYVLTAEADYEGLTYKDKIAITGLNQENVNDQIKDIWNSMRMLLVKDNIEGALELFHPVSRDHQRQVFDILEDDLPWIISTMRDIRLVAVENSRAEYRVERERIIQGQPYDITYYIIFARTGQGWRIVHF